VNPGTTPADGRSSGGTTKDRPLRALGLILLASLAFAVLAAAIKQLVPVVGVGPPLLARGLFGVVACAAWARAAGRSLVPVGWRWIALRCSAGVISVGCYYRALGPDGTDMVTAAMLLKTSPLWVALFAPAFVGERPGPRAWSALALGLCGVVLVSLDPAQGWRPDPARLGISLSLVAGLFAGLAYLALRALGRTDTPPVVVASFSVALVLVGLPLTLARHGEVEGWSSETWTLLAVAGLIGTGAQLLLTWAFRYGAAHAVTIAGLSEVGMQLVVQRVWFGKVPTAIELAGGVLAMSAGVLASPRVPEPGAVALAEAEAARRP
jgi:drug/metabolite transporter (DMT)-like permease